MPLDQQTFDSILVDIAAGEPTRKAIATHEVSCRQFYGTIDSDAQQAERYARARASSMDSLADEALAIADDQTLDPHSRRVMVDTRKWFLSKLAPKKYGEKLDMQVSGDLTVKAVSYAAIAAPQPSLEGTENTGFIESTVVQRSIE